MLLKSFCFSLKFGENNMFYILLLNKFQITKMTSQITKIRNYYLVWEALRYDIVQSALFEWPYLKYDIIQIPHFKVVIKFLAIDRAHNKHNLRLNCAAIVYLHHWSSLR